MEARPNAPETAHDGRRGWKTWAVVTAVYVACVSVATWPRVAWFRSGLPSLTDPLQHLWVMRWYKTCVFEGQSLVLCPEIQYPTGAPLGSFSPLYFQALLYAILSSVIRSDAACYNVIWFCGIVFTGLGTFVLIRHTCGDSWCAGFGGMVAMLSGAMMVHSMAHLELIFLGGFPLFLLAWLRFVDEPSPRRLGLAAGLYLVLALISAYYAVYAIFPAALYVVWKLPTARRRAIGCWLRSRGPWLLGFAIVVVPGLIVIFGNQLWARVHGYVFPRPLFEFREFGAPVWSYVLPTRWHLLGRLLPSDPYAPPHIRGNVHECCSYLGVATLVLLIYAAALRVRFARTGFWWCALVLLIVFSGGASWTIGHYEIPLPALWLKRHVLLFEQIRVPARFNLFGSVVAALVAANGLHHLLHRIRRRAARMAVFAGFAALALADLAIAPFSACSIPSMPGCYAFMKQAAPGAPFVEVPQFGSGGSNLYAVCGYWQSSHRGRTNAGYCGQGNVHFDNLLTWNSPFYANRLAQPGFLVGTDQIEVNPIGNVDFRDYVWLYMTAHKFRFAVLHQWAASLDGPPVRLDRLKAALEIAKVYEDRATVVYDRDRLPRPSHPTVLTAQGWRRGLWQDGRSVQVVDREARLVLYNPNPLDAIQIRVDTSAFQHARSVALLLGDSELARWTIQTGNYQPAIVQPRRFAEGLSELVLKSDTDNAPRFWMETTLIGDWSPYSLKVRNVGVEPATQLSDRLGVHTQTERR